MAVDEKTKKVRKELANDLNKYCELIQPFLASQIIKFDFQTALSSLNNLNKACCIGKVYHSSYWNYKISQIEIKLGKDIPKKKLPKSVCDLKLITSIEVSGDTNKTNEIDPFQSLSFNFSVKGDFICEKTGDLKTAVTSYHLDRHIYDDGDNIPEEPHPFYHFQFGGKKLIDEFGGKIDTGELLVLETPRINHYPMDFILGMDYLISNFYPNVRKQLMSSKQEYRRLIEKYQIKIVKPYFQAITSNWEKSLIQFCHSPNWTPISLYPQII